MIARIVAGLLCCFVAFQAFGLYFADREISDLRNEVLAYQADDQQYEQCQSTNHALAQSLTTAGDREQALSSALDDCQGQLAAHGLVQEPQGSVYGGPVDGPTVTCTYTDTGTGWVERKCSNPGYDVRVRE